jgi:uncharacterized membrane protein YgcG
LFTKQKLTKNQKILLGIGILAAGAYLLRKKLNASGNTELTPPSTQVPSESSVPAESTTPTPSVPEESTAPTSTSIESSVPPESTTTPTTLPETQPKSSISQNYYIKNGKIVSRNSEISPDINPMPPYKAGRPAVVLGDYAYTPPIKTNIIVEESKGDVPTESGGGYSGGGYMGGGGGYGGGGGASEASTTSDNVPKEKHTDWIPFIISGITLSLCIVQETK